MGVTVRPAQVYENVTFGGVEHLRIADEEGMFERTVTLCSASKLFSLTGERWRGVEKLDISLRPACEANEQQLQRWLP